MPEDKLLTTKREPHLPNDTVLPAPPSWAFHDPVVMHKTVPVSSGSRMDVLLDSGISRSRSLNRPERRTQAVTLPRHKSNILAASTVDPYSPWTIFYNSITCCFSSGMLKNCLGMNELEKQRAWREKVALCFIAAFLCSSLGFITFGLQASICSQERTYSASQLADFGTPTFLAPHGVVIGGNVYNIERVLTSHGNTRNALPFFQTRPEAVTAVQNAAGIDASAFFPSIGGVCASLFRERVDITCSSPAFGGIQHCHDRAALGGSLDSMLMGAVIYGWEDVSSRGNFMVFNGRVLDLTRYFSSQSSQIFGSEIDVAIRANLNTDGTKALLNVQNGREVGGCLVDMYAVGRLEAKSAGCWTSDVFLWVSFVIVMGLVMVRFGFAVYFRWFISQHLGRIMKDSSARKKAPLRKAELHEGHFPITMTDQAGNLILKHTNVATLKNTSLARHSSQKKSRSSYGNELYTIMLVTCYSEDKASLALTFDALAETEYNEDFKVLFIISDGIIKGHGNEKSTPDLILDMLEIDTNWSQPEPMSYLAVADGAKQHNKAKIYVAWYNHRGRSVPTILIVKCGLPSEKQKPGNRGKRDSQMILMRFLERITFNQRLCPLEYDLFLKMNYLMGVPPDCFEIILMVDADTKVAPDSLARMVACMASDPAIMGLCGETRIANKNGSWVTKIQVFEYYLSHHLTKAFESMFGGVTCLPGCFCMYRIKARKGESWIPIVCSPEITATYSQSVVDTLHKKNLLLLGEDRFLTTLMLRAFPRRKLIFVPRAFCKTTVPDTFAVLLSQRRRWINSTIHNLMELVLVNELCGLFCFSMQFVIFLELVGTVTLPAAICFTLLLITVSIIGTPQFLPLALLGAILGLPAVLILLTTRRVVYIYWMFIYLLALPIWNFVLPVYAFWHFDDFSWGQTRKLEGGDAGHGYGDKSEIGPDAIPLRKWEEWERDRRANIVISYRRRNRGIL